MKNFSYQGLLSSSGLILLCLCCCSVSNSWRDQARQLRPPDSSSLAEAVLDEVENRAKQSLSQIKHARTPGEAEGITAKIRSQLRRSLGIEYFPKQPELKARLMGTLQFKGYRIEKVIYETLPGVAVPVHLYIPDGIQKPAPAVVFYPGHWVTDSKSRTGFQSFCINMAKLGFVVLTFDPFGQGERGVSWRDHRRTASLLAGISQQGFAVFETRCAIDYLLSRDEVNPRRIGITGASGGGYNTWMTAVLDDRISVAVPVVGTSEFFEQIHVCRPLDWYRAKEHCHFVAGLIRYANNHELLAACAPKPLMIIAAEVDESFPIQGVRAIADYGKGLYSSFGSPERFGFFEDQGESHGYQGKKREAAYGWFRKWLMGDGNGDPVLEPQTETLPDDSPLLHCFPNNQNQPAGPGFQAFIKTLTDSPGPAEPLNLEDMFGRIPIVNPSINLEEKDVQRLEIPVEGGITIPAFLYRPSSPKGLLLAVNDQGKEDTLSDPIVNQAVEKNWAVCGIDPRGMGELEVEQMGWVAATSLLLNENFVWLQASDILNVMAALKESSRFRDIPSVLYAKGDNAGLAGIYFLTQQAIKNRPGVSHLILRDSFISYHQFIDRPGSMENSFQLSNSAEDVSLDREIPFHYFVFDVLRSFDLPDLIKVTDIRVTVIDPINGDWKPLPLSDAREILPGEVEVISMNDMAEMMLFR